MLLPQESNLHQREKLIVILLVTIAFLIPLILHALSLDILVKYAAIGAISLFLALVVISYPKVGVLFGVFYIYAGLFFYFRMHVAYPVIALVFFAAVVGLIRGESIRLRNGRFAWPLILFTIFAVQSMLFSYSMKYSIMSFLSFMKVAILTFLLVQFFYKKRDLETLLVVVFLGSICSVLFGILNLKLGLVENPRVIGGVNFLRFSGTFANPNILAVFLVSAVPMGIYLMKRSQGLLFRLLSFFGIMVILIGALSTFSRAAIFPIMVIALMILTRETRHNKGLFLLFAGAMVAAAVILIPSFYWARLLSLGDIEILSQTDWSLYLRLKAMRVALDLFAQHPLTGIGLKNFIVRSGSEMFVRIVVHNIYLEILAGVGLFGFMSLMLVYWAPIRECLKGIKRSWRGEHRYMRDLSFYMLTSVVAVLVSGFFFSNAFSYSIWVPMAGAIALGNLRRDIHEDIG